MTTAELDTLLKLLRKRGVASFEGLDIKVSFEPVGVLFDESQSFDPDNLGKVEDDEEGVEVKFYSAGIEPRK